ncbi:uncharacterized protein LOC128889814 [Hylaeus anthracinus]|uniref:uncharacterized protein LOC128889814 n=1 Tax=Hylaeus anthracinus TaxID=313031 RepID=UPI0023B8D4B1|nr:uncharacterized protein LOC128889814 [Hylaeus anthracinus]
MNSFEDDMFALSDEDLPLPILEPECNPVEEHLMKQLSDVQSRIEKTSNDIKEIQDTTRHVLKALHQQAQFGEQVSSDSDSNLYDVDGQPVVKKKKHGIRKHDQILVVQSNWKYIFHDKWVIGIVLQNTSSETVCDPEVYVTLKGLDEIAGASMIWSSTDCAFWYRTNAIQPRKEVVATVVLDLPKFDEDSFCDAYGTISYQVHEKQYQTAVPAIRLLVEETVDNSCCVKFSVNVEHSILALKSTSIEKTVGIQIETHPGRGERLFEFLEEKSFKEICADAYVVKTTGCLMFCLIEILPIVDGQARLRIFSRSTTQMNIISRLLRDQFPDMIVHDDDERILAALAFIEELKLYLRDGNTTERQMARIKTDLLIPR